MTKKVWAILRNRELILSFYSCIMMVGSVGIYANGFTPKCPQASTIEGRWDITIDMNGKLLPSWLEVRHSGSHRLIGEYVGAGGSAGRSAKVSFAEGKMNFTIPPQWEKEDNDIVFEATLQGDSLTG